MKARTAGVSEVHFQAALSDPNSPIIQRRSGKPCAGVRQSPSRLARCEFPESIRPIETLESGKVAARAVSSALSGERRLAFARAFCRQLVRTYWFDAQRKYVDPWHLANDFSCLGSDLDGAALSLAQTMGEAAAQLDPIIASYLIGSTYTAMLPDETRSRLGVYYTPPGLTRRLLQMATAAGVDWKSCHVIDPACGGGAFLAPVAAKLVSENRHLPPRQLVQLIANRVRGMEIDPFSAWASQVFLEATVMEVCREAGERLPSVIQVCNSLLTEIDNRAYDLVIGNPPYGRVTLNPQVRSLYQRGLYGHANLYGLFTDLAVQLTRPGGVIAYVTPTSFLAGEYFKALRKLLAIEAPPMNLDFVSARKGVFDDALQETLLSTYKRESGSRTVTVHFIRPTGYDQITIEPAGTFVSPEPTGDPWLVPRSPDQAALITVLQGMTHRLSDYGYQVSTGPLVWNRHKEQLAAGPCIGALPLLWAECVTAEGKFLFRADKKNHEPYFKPKPGDEWLIARKSCVLLQRTTAKEQNRRLIAANLPQKFLSAHGAVVVENHLNMIKPVNRPRVPPEVLVAMLNSSIIDNAFRCLSGSVAVSAYELEALPLPPPEALAAVTKLVESRAPREAIEEACRQLFARREGA